MSVSVWILWNRIWKLWLTRHFLEVEFERNCPRGFFWESNSTLHWLFVWIFHATAIQKNLRVTQDFVSLLVRVQATQLKEHLRVGTASNLDQRLTQGELLLPFLILSTKLYPNLWNEGRLASSRILFNKLEWQFSKLRLLTASDLKKLGIPNPQKGKRSYWILNLLRPSSVRYLNIFVFAFLLVYCSYFLYYWV